MNKTNSIEDLGFQRKAKAVNGRKTHRKKNYGAIFNNYGQIPKPNYKFVFWRGNPCRILNGEQHACIKRNFVK